MPSSNETLAWYYDETVPQLIIIYPLVWWHSPKGDWVLKNVLQDGVEAVGGLPGV